jgi:hypothetical protein
MEIKKEKEKKEEKEKKPSRSNRRAIDHTPYPKMKGMLSLIKPYRGSQAYVSCQETLHILLEECGRLLHTCKCVVCANYFLLNNILYLIKD